MYRITIYTPVGIFEGNWEEITEKQLESTQEFFKNPKTINYFVLRTKNGELNFGQPLIRNSVILLEHK